jgi:hypothetical protein
MEDVVIVFYRDIVEVLLILLLLAAASLFNLYNVLRVRQGCSGAGWSKPHHDENEKDFFDF